MTCITRQHVGKYTYLYESTSYRDERGKPRNKKVRIGKLDPETGEEIYDASYLEREGEKLGRRDEKDDRSDQEGQKNKWDASQEISYVEKILDRTKNYGSFYLFITLANKIGLLSLLESIFPSYYKEIFVLSCFLVEMREPLMYCEEWLSNTLTFKEIHNLDSKYISRLLSRIESSEINTFFQSWIKNVKDNGYIAFDITSISSYSELIDGCEWGYNRDKERLPQINLCMLFGEDCKFPVFF